LAEVILDAATRAKLKGLDQQLLFRDEAGNILGMFLPPEAYRRLAYGSVQIPLSPEEVERGRQETGGGSLEEFWRKMGV
jgi:hypothetical protein